MPGRYREAGLLGLALIAHRVEPLRRRRYTTWAGAGL